MLSVSSDVQSQGLGLWEVALFGPDGAEFAAAWYARRRYEPEVTWTVFTSRPLSGERWTVASAALLDTSGTAVHSWPVGVTLSAALGRTEPLTEAQVAFRRSRGIPLEDNPHKGDTLAIHFQAG